MTQDIQELKTVMEETRRARLQKEKELAAAKKAERKAEVAYASATCKYKRGDVLALTHGVYKLGLVLGAEMEKNTDIVIPVLCGVKKDGNVMRYRIPFYNIQGRELTKVRHMDVPEHIDDSWV